MSATKSIARTTRFQILIVLYQLSDRILFGNGKSGRIREVAAGDGELHKTHLYHDRNSVQGAHAFLRNENKTFITPQPEKNKTFLGRKFTILTDEKTIQTELFL